MPDYIVHVSIKVSPDPTEATTAYVEAFKDLLQHEIIRHGRPYLKVDDVKVDVQYVEDRPNSDDDIVTIVTVGNTLWAWNDIKVFVLASALVSRLSTWEHQISMMLLITKATGESMSRRMELPNEWRAPSGKI